MNSYLFVNCVEIYKFGPKDSKTNAVSLYLDNILKDFTIDNLKKKLIYLDISLCFVQSLASNPEGIIKYVSLNNRQCQARPTFINMNL